MKTLNHTTDRTEDSISIMTILGVAAAGMFLIYFTGFAEAEQFHDSAHDTRHTLAFPCH
jgi:cobalt transporter subunit CbtB